MRPKKNNKFNIRRYLKPNLYYSNAMVFLGCFVFWIIFSISRKSPENYPSYFNNNLFIYGKGLPKYMHFCNDTLPLNDLEVKTAIQKEFYERGLIKNKSSALLLISRCNRWFPFIEPILKKYNLPDDIKYVALIESHLSNVTSPMGAKGFWQLLPSTAQSMGLEVNEYVDERLDVEKSTIAACKYFLQAFQELKNWSLVAAAYNYGINGIKYQLEKQNVTSYHHLQLNKETKEFVYRIIAYKTLLTYPEYFGIKRKLLTRKKPYLKTISVDTSITNIKFLAQYIHCPTLLLKAFNPWLLSESLPNNNKKKYIFQYPANTAQDYSAYISDVLGYDYNYEPSAENANIKKDSMVLKDSSNLPAYPKTVSE